MSEVLESRPTGVNLGEWTHGTLGDVLRVRNGYAFKSTDYQTSGVLLVRQSNLGGDRVSVEKAVYLPPQFAEQYSDFLVRKGDILIGMSGSIGKLCLYDRDEPALQNQRTGLLIFKNDSLRKWVWQYLPVVERQLLADGKGVGVQNVSGKQIEALPLPVAPAHLRESIVADLEKQFSRLDEAVANLQRVKANLKRYKASVLKAAVEGRLVETEATLARREGRTYVTGEQLLQRILEERRTKWAGRGKYKAPVTADAADQDVLPEGWATASLDMISTDSGYGTSQKCGYENDGPAVLRIPNVQHGVLDLQDLKFAPTEFKLDQPDAVSSGDMLIIRTNGSKSLIGRAAVVMAEPQRRMSFASYLIRFRLSSADCIPAWVSVVWQTSQMREWIEAHAATSAGQHNVSMTVLAKAAIPLPPVTEQARIVAEVDRHLSIIREVETEVDANLQRAQALRQATLAKAFSVC